MRLLIARSVRRTFWGRRIYRITLAAEAHPVEKAIIDDNALRGDEVWVSSAFNAFESEAESSFQTVENTSGWFLSQALVRRRLSIARQGLRSLKHGFDEAYVTVGDLLGHEGISFEGRDIGQLLSVEAGVRSGVETLQAKIEMLCRYEAGNGIIVEREAAPVAANPAVWVRLR